MSVDKDETLAQLLDAIRVKANNQNIEWATAPEPLTGGFWAQLWRLRLSGDTSLEGQLVARVMPDPGTAARETLVQAHLANNGFATPKVRLFSAPTEQFELAWMLMDFAKAEPLIPDLSGAGTLLRLPRLARSMPDTLAQAAADLHRVPTNGLTEQLGISGGFDYFLRSMCDAMIATGNHELASFADSIINDRPETTESVICHGDLHPFNVLVGDHGYTVLDWSVTHLASRNFDLAFTHLLLSNPPLEAPAALDPMIRFAGSYLGKRFIKSYECFSNTRIDEHEFEWFTRVSALRVFTDIESWRRSGGGGSDIAHPFEKLDPVLRKRYLGVA